MKLWMGLVLRCTHAVNRLGVSLKIKFGLAFLCAILMACGGRESLELPEDLSFKPGENGRVRAKLMSASKAVRITPEQPFEGPIDGIVQSKSEAPGRRYIRLVIKVSGRPGERLQLDVPVLPKHLKRFNVGDRVQVGLTYPPSDVPVIPGTLSVSLRKLEDEARFVLLHGQQELEGSLSKGLKIGWGRTKNARLESSTRAFCERTQERFAFDLSGTTVGAIRRILPGQELHFKGPGNSKLALRAGDCTRVVGGNCPDDVRGLWDCQLVMTQER